MTFASPLLLLTLLVLPFAVAGYALLERRRARRAAAWARPVLLPNVVDRPPHRARHVPVALFLLALAALLVGFARPQRTVLDASSSGPTVVVLVDVSGSMAARDVGPSRIAAARAVAAGLVTGLPARDRVAVLSFGDRIGVLVPPTLDRADAIAHLPSKITPKAGTSLGDAISDAVAVVTASAGRTGTGESYPGAVVVLSDGTQTAGGTLPAQAGETAFVQHVPVEAVAIGTRGGTVTQRLSVDGFDTSAAFPVPVDAHALNAVAHASGGVGIALAARAGEESAVAKLHAATRDVRAPAQPVRRVQTLSAAAAALALALVLAGVAASTLWLGRVA